jgi:hypothetical protein
MNLIVVSAGAVGRCNRDARAEVLVGVAAVKALAAAAPVLPYWNVIAFRPRRSAMMAISFSGRTVRPKDVEFSLLSNGRELWITLFFDGYRESERAIWGQIGYLLLDQALGEYDVETKVGPIQLMRRSQVPSMSFLAHCFHSAAK